MTTAAAPRVQVPVRVRVRAEAKLPTIWGCTPREIHDRFWAAFGVHVVRRGSSARIDEGAELFLLIEPGMLVLLRLAQVLEAMYWLRPRLLVLRIADTRPQSYREVVVTRGDELVRFERVYRRGPRHSTRAALTGDARVAARWQAAAGSPRPWRALREFAGDRGTAARAAEARVYDEGDGAQVAECLRDAMRLWKRPEATFSGVLRHEKDACVHERASVAGAVFHGPVWVGAGRRLAAGTHVVGPAILWDDPAVHSAPPELHWLEIEPSQIEPSAARPAAPRNLPGKRAFDVVFAACALAVTLPLYPLVAAAIFAEDRGPIFFAHRRETLGGREFPCLKFRSMRKRADLEKSRIAAANVCDGPQFFVKDDPRVTHVGRLLRKFHIDELPQFVNVLLGHMSVVGPRPSPYVENQYCPTWREARLSVRPGVTGLWQVSRTRRKGLDFQEWIRFDLEYVERAGWRMDLLIIAKTIRTIAAGGA